MATEIVQNSRQAQHGDWIEIEDAGAAIADGAFQQLSTAVKTQLDEADLEGCEFIDLLMTDVTLSAAPGSGKTIAIHSREMNLNGAANDTAVPDANYSNFRNTFDLDNATTIAAIYTEFVSVAKCDNEIYLENNSGVTVNSDYKVYARARSVGPKA